MELIPETDLLQVGADVAERTVQLAAKALHDCDDRDGNAGGDEAILDGGRARLIFDETLNQALHG